MTRFLCTMQLREVSDEEKLGYSKENIKSCWEVHWQLLAASIKPREALCVCACVYGMYTCYRNWRNVLRLDWQSPLGYQTSPSPKLSVF